MGALALTAGDLRQIDGEARIEDLRLAEVLGFARPYEIRKLIRKNLTRLGRHGLVFAAAAKTQSKRGRVGEGRPGKAYYLNEQQSYRLSMWSEAPNADAVQEQMVEVFFAWRHGKLVEPTASEMAFDRLERRLNHLERLVGAQAMVETPEFVRASRFAPPIMQLRRPDGSLRKQRNPKHYNVAGAREAVWRLHRQTPLNAAVREINDEFGEGTISRTALGRAWKLLDRVRCPE